MEESVQKTKVPNGIVSLVMGAVALCFSFWAWHPFLFPGIIAIVCAIIGMVMSKKGYALYNENPEAYLGAGMLKAGKILSIIGLIIGIIGFIIAIVLLCLGSYVGAF